MIKASTVAVAAMLASGVVASAAGWAVVRSADVGTNEENVLNAVGCAAAAECWAVGYVTSSTTEPLVEEASASGWTVTPNPLPGGGGQLNGVTCAAADDCWAVGWQGDNEDQTLMEHYDGQSWSMATSADVSGFPNYLNGVACSSANDCWAVGYYVTVAPPPSGAAPWQTLIEHYDGSRWTLSQGPDPAPTKRNVLAGVACLTTGCWAVGWYQSSAGCGTAGCDQTLIASETGGVWLPAASADTSSNASNFLSGVACPATGKCVAVGYVENPGQPFQTLIETQSATGWLTTVSPSPGNGSQLNAVTCGGPDCWAVGAAFENGDNRTLIEQQVGDSWIEIASPDAGGFANMLNGISCVGTDACWAVGTWTATYDNDGQLLGVDQTLVMSSAGPPPSVPEWPAGIGGVVGVAAATVLTRRLMRADRAVVCRRRRAMASRRAT